MKYTSTVAVFILAAQGLAAQILSPSSMKAINSSYDEQNPRLSPDGRLLFFTVANHPQNMGGRRDPGDIWFSVFVGEGQWSAPVHAGSNINNSAYNAVIGISRDMSYLFLLGHYGSAGEPALTQGIAVSRRRDSGWSYPENIAIPYFLNRSQLGSGYVTPDGNILVYSAESYETKGAEDLYVSIRDEAGKWLQPKHLGATVNSGAQEVSPWISDDGRTLLYAGNGFGGQGSFDIFRSTRAGESWTAWTTPENVAALNSDARELYAGDYPDRGFLLYTTTKDSDGYGDLRVHFPFGERAADSLALKHTLGPDSSVRIIEVGKRSGAEREVRVHGRVRSTESGSGIRANLAVSQNDRNWKIESAADGAYEVTIPSTDLYLIRIEAPGFVSHLEKLDIHTYELQALELNFDLEPIAVGTTVNLKSVLFQQGTTKLLPESYPELDVVADFLLGNPKVRIRLSGHTDNRGSAHLNHQLSQQRVDVVKRYLVNKGISAKRISGRGYGGTKPLASNDTEETRKLNRRVEFTITKD
jgi:outer membrane protein OmpA-like peptidoglycan-associated protein